MKDLLSHLKYIKSSVLIFLLKKCEELLHSTAKAPHIFSAKNDSAFALNTFEILIAC